MLQILKDNSILIVALTGSVAAYLLGMITSHLRREKRWLGYPIISQNIVQALPRISMKFDGRDIQSLDIHIVNIQNIGNRSLADIPIRIVASAGADIVEHDVEAPEGARFSAGKRGDSEITIKCDLLNPGEAAAIELKVADCEHGFIKVFARHEGIVLKYLGNQRTSRNILDRLLEADQHILSTVRSARRRTRS